MLRIYDPWLTTNKLTHNKSKTAFMLIGSRQKLNTFNSLPSFTIDSDSIKKSLGVYIDENFSPGQTDRQVVASGRKLNLGRDLRWVAKRSSKFPCK